MSAKHEFIDYINDIRDSIEKIHRFTNGMDYTTFTHDEKTAYAAIRALEVIGEAAKKIPDSIKSQYSSVPWRDIESMRNKLIHEYFGVILSVVWKTIKEDLPVLRDAINIIAKETQEKT